VDVLIEKLSSRKFWAFVVGIAGAFLYAFGVIDEKGLGAIIAAGAAYQVGEGLADFGQGRAVVAAASKHEELDRLLDE
jgi:hypothetical protein